MIRKRSLTRPRRKLPLRTSDAPATDTAIEDSIYRAQRITYDLLRQVAKEPPPDKPKEILDSATGWLLRHERTGTLTLHALMGRHKRKRICNVRDILDTDNREWTFERAKRERKILQGKETDGGQVTAASKAERGVPTLRHYLANGYREALGLNPEHGRVEETLERLRTCFDKPFGGKKLSAITPSDVRKWRAKRLAKKKSPGTVNRDIATLASLLNTHAQERKEAGQPWTNPLLGFGGLKLDKKHKRRHFKDDEYSLLLAALEARETRRREARASANAHR